MSVPGSRVYVTAAAGAAAGPRAPGDDAAIELAEYGETIVRDSVRVSLHPAGHILGSAQVRIEQGGRGVGGSGDYKLEPDPTCAPFEPMRCHTFVTESHLRPADLPLASAGARCSPRSTPGGAPTARRARPACCSPSRWARRSACWRAWMRPSGPIYTHGAVERVHARSIARPASRCPQRRPIARRLAGALIVGPADRCAARRGCGSSARRLRRWPRAGCGSAARGGGNRSTAASCSPITPTGRGCMTAIDATGARARLGHARLSRRRWRAGCSEKGMRGPGRGDALSGETAGRGDR